MKQNTQFLRHAALIALLAGGVATAAHAQRVTRDAQTGELRAPTADEVRAMDAAGSRKAAPAVGIMSGRANPAPVRLRNGTVMQELTTDTMMYSVARRNADGTVSQYCVHGDEAAQRIVKGPQAKAQVVVSKAGKELSYELK
jgi:hypothetical protein